MTSIDLSGKVALITGGTGGLGLRVARWLIDNGYMVLKEPADGKRYLATVDWSKTRAYAVGLVGIFLNLAGREEHGIVQPGEEADRLKEELVEKLVRLLVELSQPENPWIEKITGLARSMDCYAWENLIEAYDRELEQLAR